MKRTETVLLSLLVVLFVWRCASTATPVAAGGHTFKNLKVLRADMTREELMPIMKGFTRALGVRCTFCHEGDEGAMDFASDAKDEKRNARVMIEMTRAINQEYISRVEGHGVVVECATCHRGKVIPESMQAAQPQAEAPH
jgi:hypothetical protein